MRNLLLTSTAALCLVLAGQAVHAQSEHQKKEEIKKEHVQQQQEQKKDEQQAQQQQQNRHNTPGQAADEKNSEPSKDATSPSEKKDQNAASKPNSETNKNAQTEKSKRDEHKKSAEEQKHNATPSKSTASEQNKANESAKPSTAEAPKSSTQQKQDNASTPNSNTNATNNKSTNTNTTNNSTDKATTNTANQAQPSSKAAAQVDPQKKVQISETISKHHDLAAPVKNLNISITVGERVPSHVHLHRLPREIVTIAPEYRDYDYFTTEEDVVIVSPRTHEIVTRIPRDASRARAEAGGSSTTITSSSGGSGGGSMPCQVMRRTASGDTHPIDPGQLRQTTGSGGSNDRLAVRVQAPNGQTMPEITLPDREGRIIAETNGNGCRVILDPGPVNQ